MRSWKVWVPLSLWLLLVSGVARPVAFDVTINTGTLAGGAGILTFDLIDGGPPGNTVNLGPITTDGSPVGAITTGGVNGSGPWVITDSSFFNELQIIYDPLGSTISFSFSTTDNPPDGGSLPDSFALFLLDPSSLLSLLSTSDPTGADALFLFSFGSGAQGLEVYRNVSASVQDFSVQVNVSPPTNVPEPGSLALLAIGVILGLIRKPRVR